MCGVGSCTEHRQSVALGLGAGLFSHCSHEGRTGGGWFVCRSMRFQFGMRAPWPVSDCLLLFFYGMACQRGPLTVSMTYSDTPECVVFPVVLSCPHASRMYILLSLDSVFSWAILSSGCMITRMSLCKRTHPLRILRWQPLRRQHRRCGPAPCHRRPRSIFYCWSKWRGCVGLRCSDGGGRGSSTLPNSIEGRFLPVCLPPLLLRCSLPTSSSRNCSSGSIVGLAAFARFFFLLSVFPTYYRP